MAALAAIVLVGTLGAYMLYLQGIADAGPVKASLLCSIEPVSAMVISLLWLHVPVTPWDALGCAAIVCMVLLVTEREKPAAGGQEGGAALAGAKAEDPPLFAGRASELGYYADRPATREDFAEVSRLLAAGRDSMAALGIDEGPKKYPSSRRLMHSIKNGTCHVVEDAHGRPLAVFAVSFSPDKNYARGIKGAWLTDTLACPQPYAELHWVAVDGYARRRGVGAFVLDRACEIARAGGRFLPARRRVPGQRAHAAPAGEARLRALRHGGGARRVRAPETARRLRAAAVTGLRAARGAGCGGGAGMRQAGRDPHAGRAMWRTRDARRAGKGGAAGPSLCRTGGVRRARRADRAVCRCLYEGDWTRWISARLARRT